MSASSCVADDGTGIVASCHATPRRTFRTRHERILKTEPPEKCKHSAPLYPSLYQVNTRVWLTELSRQLGRAATMEDIPDAELDRFAGMGFDWLWFLICQVSFGVVGGFVVYKSQKVETMQSWPLAQRLDVEAMRGDKEK